MTKILVLYYSTYGHVEAMAEAVADGARGWPKFALRVAKPMRNSDVRRTWRTGTPLRKPS